MTKKALSCPHCGELIAFTKVGTSSSIARARATVLEKMKTYCTKEMHAQRAKTMRYCNLCHKRITTHKE